MFADLVDGGSGIAVIERAAEAVMVGAGIVPAHPGVEAGQGRAAWESRRRARAGSLRRTSDP